MMETPETVRNYWFGSALNDAAAVAAQRAQLWWSKNPRVDDEIRQRFESYVIKAGARELDHWGSNPQDRLALILLTDQFPRSIYRDSRKAFAFDSQALSLSRDGIDAGFDRTLHPLQRVFFYLPLEHSESPADQDRSVSLFGQLVEQAGPDHKPTFQEYLDFALRHRNIIDRFGRFPHRNEVLGRASTEEELSFLQQPGGSF
jgi:uncharacterized protein (DUF924 family)